MNSTGDLSDETRSMLLELLRGIYGANAAIKDIKVVNQHHDYAALLVTMAKPTLKLAVKLASREAPYSYPFDRTAYWHQIVREQTSVPMPEIIAFDVSYRDYPWRYLIKTFIPGEVWADVRPQLHGEALKQAYAQMGQAVAELHNITFERFGDLEPNSGEQTKPDFYSVLKERVKSTIGIRHIQQNFLELLDTNHHLFTDVAQPRLCHEDLHPYNILFHQHAGEWQFATILDFDKAWAGHHEIDLAKLDLWDGMTGEGFWERYTKIMTVDDGYLERRPFYQLWWCLEYAANTAKHLADTRRLCELLKFPIIERFE